jgi:tetratricopeptide (TPR) repeat protein
MTQAYYAGDYQQVVDFANRILSAQPGNAAALEYRQKAEDNLIRGVVPDFRIPFDARVAYNRANSLVRAGNYDEAERLYREARDLAERSGILSWKDAEQALLDIQDLALARELLNEGDRLIAADNWSEAVRKYEGALRVVPNDPMAEERLEKARRIQSDIDQASVQLTMLGGTLSEQVTQVQSILNLLTRVRQLLPNSSRLLQLTNDAQAKLAAIKAQLHDQAGAAVTRANNAASLDERIALTNEALSLTELAARLDPSDGGLAEMLSNTRVSSSEIDRAELRQRTDAGAHDAGGAARLRRRQPLSRCRRRTTLALCRTRPSRHRRWRRERSGDVVECAARRAVQCVRATRRSHTLRERGTRAAAGRAAALGFDRRRGAGHRRAAAAIQPRLLAARP